MVKLDPFAQYWTVLDLYFL